MSGSARMGLGHEMDSAEEWASRLPVTRSQQVMCIATIRQVQTDALRFAAATADSYSLDRTKSGETARTIQRRILSKVLRIVEESLGS